jgi:beta propeller repeat protein
MKIRAWSYRIAILAALVVLAVLGGAASAAGPGGHGLLALVAAPLAPAQGTPTPTVTVTPVGPTPSATPTLSASASPSATRSRTPIPGVIDGGNGNQQAPKASANFVVWEDNGVGTDTWDIQARDLATGDTFDVIVDPTYDERHPAISGNLIVWQDNRNGTWDIYGSYITSDEAGTPFAIYTGPGDQINPAVSGNTVVWQTIQPTPTVTAGPDAPTGVGRWDVQGVNLQAGLPFTLTNGTTNNVNPAIDGSNVVWQTAPPTSTQVLTSQWTIQGQNLSNAQRFGFADTPGDEINPVISGNIVVWQEISPTLGLGPQGVGRWTLAGGDITSSGTFTVSNAPGDQTNPQISGNDVVFQQYQSTGLGSGPFGVGRWSVIQTTIGGGSDMTVSDSPENATLPTVANGQVLWQQNTPDGDYDVYGDECYTEYSDVNTGDYFYEPVQFLACSQVVSGYGDGTFRPYNLTTRGQLAKIVVLSAGFDIVAPGPQHFSDVPPGSPFYLYIETAYQNNLISGYGDGTFRPNAQVTRAQLSKIVVLSQGWAINTTGGPHFTDVPASDPFYDVIETAYNKGIISGYSDHTFRAGAPATRGQIAKIVYLALYAP